MTLILGVAEIYFANPKIAVCLRHWYEPCTVTAEEALALYDRRADKEWSFTDCTSFLVMGDQKLTTALTTDHHFEQAGFTILLK